MIHKSISIDQSISSSCLNEHCLSIHLTIRDGETSIAGICLVQAVRSFLHFSQLSAWLNKSSGSRPQQLLYRVTMPGQAFASKFASKPVEHHFPLAHVGRLATHAIKVTTHFLLMISFFFFFVGFHNR